MGLVALLRDERIHRLVDDVVRLAREDLLVRERPTRGPDVVVYGDAADVVEILGAPGGFFCPEWPFSYHYRGEDANLVRFYTDYSYAYPYRQEHVRLYDEDFSDGWVGLEAHSEPSSLAHKAQHLDGVEFEREGAIASVARLLDGADITYFVPEELGERLRERDENRE